MRGVEIMKLLSLKKQKGRFFLFFVLILLILIIAYFSLFNKNNSYIQVNTMTPYTTDISKTITLSGNISSDFEEIFLPSNLKILKTYVSESSKVNSGDILAELDSEDIMLRLEKSKISLEQLYSDLLEAKKQSSSSDKAILYNNYLRSKEQYFNIQHDYDSSIKNIDKNKVLLGEGAISQADFDNQLTANKNLESSLKIAKLNYQDAELSYRDYEDNIQLKIDSIERQIESLNIDIKSLNKDLKDREIRTSITGIITYFPLSELRKTTENTTIKIQAINKYEFISYATQEDAVYIKEGQKASVTIKGISKIYEGTVRFISKSAEPDKASGSSTPKVEIKIMITDIDDFLKSGFEGDATIQIEFQENALVVKREVVKKDADGKEFIFAVYDNTAKKTYVETGISNDNNISILSGINENDTVIINPSLEIFEGTPVKIIN
jgi:HlyD family secretion protein